MSRRNVVLLLRLAAAAVVALAFALFGSAVTEPCEPGFCEPLFSDGVFFLLIAVPGLLLAALLLALSLFVARGGNPTHNSIGSRDENR